MYLTKTIKKLSYLLGIVSGISLLMLNFDSIFKEKNIHARPPQHSNFTLLLKKHVKNGLVDYRSFKKDIALLEDYLSTLANSPVDITKWTKSEELCYWINLYNASTLLLILKNYPISSIKDLNKNIYIPFINSVFDRSFIKVGSQEISLNKIEHEIIRKNFNEPLVHFALVCASKSCPKLRNEAYEASKLAFQLNEQAQDFINDSSKNTITENALELSSIFKWFKKDFEKEYSLLTFLGNFTEIKISDNSSVTFKEFDWELNEYKN